MTQQQHISYHLQKERQEKMYGDCDVAKYTCVVDVFLDTFLVLENYFCQMNISLIFPNPYANNYPNIRRK